MWSIVFMFHWESTLSWYDFTANIKYWLTDALSVWHKYNVIAYTVVFHGRLDTRVETRCPGGVSISCLASRSRHFSYSEIEFYFQVLVKFFFHTMPRNPYRFIYTCINLLFKIITSLWGRSALDNPRLNDPVPRIRGSLGYGGLDHSV